MTTYQLEVCHLGKASWLGYARVSRADQVLSSQRDQLREAGVGRIYSEHCSSVSSRPGWQALLSVVRRGDVVCVTRLDRIGRRLSEVVACVEALTAQGVHVRALQQGIDTSAPGGTIIVALWAALAEVERTTLQERTREGLAAAKARGKKAGRPVVLDGAKRELVKHLRAKGHSITEIARAVKAGATTVSRALRDFESPDPVQLRIGEVVEAPLPTLPEPVTMKVRARKPAKGPGVVQPPRKRPKGSGA